MPAKMPLFSLRWLLVPIFFWPVMVFSQCWPRSEKLLPEKAYNNFEGFGRAIDHENGIAVVGAPQSDTARTSSGVVYVFQFNGSSWTKIASLAPSDHRLNQNFGSAVKIAGDYIFVGDPARLENGKRTGAVYVFKKPVGGWSDMVETIIMKSTDPKTLSFGTSLDVFGSTLIVGAPYSLNNDGNTAGAAYVFQLQGNAWTQIARLSTSHLQQSTFGSNVAIRSNMAVVVASEETQAVTTGPGAVYVFEKDPSLPWSDAMPAARLTALASAGSIWHLGYGLAVDEPRSTIFVTDNFEGSGEIRVYKKPLSGWTDMTESFTRVSAPVNFSYGQTLQFEEPYLYYPNGSAVAVARPGATNEWSTLDPIAFLENTDYHGMQQFGCALSVNNGRVLIGAHGQVTLDRDNPVIAVTPSVYEFIMPPSGWAAGTHLEDHKFTYMPSTATDFTYGSQVDIEGDIAIVSSPRDNQGGMAAGAVYVYQLVDLKWKKIAKLTPSDGEPHDYFGGSVSISNNVIAVSAVNKHHRDASGKIIDFNLGAVYIFEKSASGWADMHETYKLIRSEGKIDNTNDDRDDDNFGVTIDMDHPYLVVSKYDQGSRPNSGSVYVYKLGEGNAVLEATLNPSTRSAVNDFGHAIKIQNNTIFIGGGPLRFWFIEANMVFVYEKKGDAWRDGVESAVLYPSDISYGAAFGYSIDANEDASKIIIGAPGWFRKDFVYDAQNYFKGAAYIYEKPAAGWSGRISEKVQLTVPNQPSYGCMGVSVHIEDRYAAVGSPQSYFSTNGGSNEGSGRVYFYQMPDTGWAYKLPDKIIEGDEAGNPVSDYFGSAVEGVFGFLMVGAIADDNQNSVDAGAVYVFTEYPFIFPGQSPVCEDQPPVKLNAFPDGGIWSGSGFQNPPVGLFDPAWAGVGMHRIKYRVDGCDASNTLLIEVKRILKSFSMAARDSLFFCGADELTLNAPAGEDLAYQWEYSAMGTGFSTLPHAVLPQLTAKHEGFYKAQVSNFCSVLSDTVWVGDLYPKAGLDFAVCMSGETMPLNGNYSKGIWIGSGVTTTGLFSSTAAGAGEHMLLFTVSPVQGCIYKDTVKVQVKGIPDLAINATDAESFCYTGTATLIATRYPNVSYEWYFGENKQSLTPLGNGNNVLDAHALGYYQVVAFDGLCSSDTHYQLAAVLKPTITPSFDSIAFCQNSPLEVAVQPIPDANYIWFRQDNDLQEVIGESVGSSAMLIREAGKYKVHVMSHGCEYLGPDMTATKIPADSVFVPNIITPNGDNLNDTFEMYTVGFDTYFLRIFDRYGKEVFKTDNNGIPWRGNDSSGVYFWALTYFAQCENRHKAFKGTLHVMK